MKICILASGSKGNSIYLESAGFNILIDVGLSRRELTKRLSQIHVSLSDINAIIITHEHSDHVRSLGNITRSYHIPIYMSEGTYNNLSSGTLRAAKVQFIQSNEVFGLDSGIQVEPVSIPHDAADPMSLIFQAESKKIGIATDLGYVTRRVGTRLIGANAIILESNHDEDMLMRSNYPWRLKQRILSRDGHLSNKVFNNALSKLIHCDLERVFLAHLSEQNNCPNLARKLATKTIKNSEHPNIAVHVGKQHTISPLLEV